ncbi:MAG: diaminopimelate decarboxylase family protein [Nitrososphaeria archaeon]|jgi:diaminopimelate decarboxylase
MEKGSLLFKEEKTAFAQPTYDEQVLNYLAEKVGTPYYLTDERTIARNYERLKNAYSVYKGNVIIAYSVKANFNPYILNFLSRMGSHFDVTSAEELYFLLKSGGSPENVIYTSVTETESEYREVMSKGVRRIVVSSMRGMYNAIEAGRLLNVVPEISVRVNPEVQVRAEVRSAMKVSKFGVPLNGSNPESAYKMVKILLDEPSVKFGGFHFHLGSQLEDPNAYLQALEKIKQLILKIKKEREFKISFLDLGGGTPVNYGVKVPTPEEIASTIIGKINELVEVNGDFFTLAVESGRYIVAESTVMVSRIVNTKYYGTKKIIYLDAGYHYLLDIALLQQVYPLEVVGGKESNEEKPIVAGRLCDSMDVFQVGPESKLDGAEPGKLVLIKNVGAYSLVFNMPFHSQVKPAVIYRSSDGKYYLARKKQELEDLYEEEGGSLLKDRVRVI